MKKWVISLSILLGISAIGTGITAGKIYKQELKMYEQNIREDLVKEALKNVYITSDIPIRLEVTKGEPYVELESSIRGIMETEPEYKIDITTQGESSYIHFKEMSRGNWHPLIMQRDQVVTIYLPEQDINELEIKNGKTGYQYIDYNLDNVNINHLNVEAGSTDMNLNGSYKTINLNTNYGDVSINSKIPAELTLKGRGSYDLKGQYSLIDADIYNGDIDIYSSIPTKVAIESNGGEIRLLGSYQDIDVQNGYGSVEIRSNTQSNVSVYASADIELEGPFNKVDVKSNYGDVNLISTIQPERINLFGNYQEVSVTLPKNISGFEATYKKNYAEQEIIYTDFNAKMGQIGNLIGKVEYGDVKTKVMIENSNNKVYILEGSGNE